MLRQNVWIDLFVFFNWGFLSVIQLEANLEIHNAWPYPNHDKYLHGLNPKKLKSRHKLKLTNRVKKPKNINRLCGSWFHGKSCSLKLKKFQGHFIYKLLAFTSTFSLALLNGVNCERNNNDTSVLNKQCRFVHCRPSRLRTHISKLPFLFSFIID